MNLLLDNNVLNYLVAPEGARDQRLLKTAVELGRFRVIYTPALNEEVGAAHHGAPEKSRQMAEVALSLSEGRFLRPDPERCEEELRQGRKLSDEEAFYSWSQSRRLFEMRQDPSSLDRLLHEAGESAYQRKRTFTTHEKEFGEQARKTLGTEDEPGTWPTEIPFNDWRDTHAADLARGHMTYFAARANLPLDAIQKLDPRALPSFWRRACFYLVRNIRVHAARRSWLPSDIFDQAHFVDAAYADVLVSNDEAFRQTAAETGIATEIIGTGDALWRNLLGL